MTLTTKAFAALLAACIAILAALPAVAEVAPYDMSAPQNLSPEHLYAQSALLIDEETGEVLFTKNAKVRMYPASTTKIMTLLLGLESDIDLDAQVTIPAEAGDVPSGSSVIPVKPGDMMTWRDLLYSFMLSSGNDGANAVAVLVDGSIDAFVARMNARAAEIGLEGTHYVNAHGYHDAEHYTTAQDLATLARFAMQNETFRDVVRQPRWTITVTRGGQTKSTEIISRNTLLQEGEKYYYPDCTGIKTGHHGKAGWCFVGSAERDGMRVICVVLNCEGEMDKWYDAAKLFEYGFTRYEDVPGEKLLERATGQFSAATIEGAAPGEETLPLDLYDVNDGGAKVKALADSDASLDHYAEQLASTAEVKWTRDLTAPVSQGEIMGSVRCTLPGGGEVTAKLVAARDVAAQPTAAPVVVTEAPVAPVETEQAPPLPPEAQRKGASLGAVLIVLALLLILCVAAAWAIHERREKRRRARRRKRRKRP